MKKKVNYKFEYHKYFNIINSEAIDEYEYIVNNKIVMANKIHHVIFGSHKFEDITNWMALTTENHNKAHREEFNRYYLHGIHIQFLKNNPY